MTDKLLALGSDWLKSQPRDKQAGLLLGAYHERAGVKQGWLAQQIGASTQTLYQWESGKIKLPEHRAGQLIPYLDLTDKEAKHFILLADPDIAKRVHMPWLDKQIKQKNWQTISFPAFDDEWLAAQPQDTRASLMLRAGRQRKHMSQEELGTLLGTTREAENHWELGGHVPANKVGSIITHLDFSEAEAEKFARLASPAAAKADGQWLHEHLQPASAPVLDFPALDDAWLNAQPEGARAGLLLRAYRERAHLSQPDIADALHVKKHIVCDWELATHKIPAHRLGSLAGILKLSEVEAEKFILTAHPELEQVTGREWLRVNIEQKNWRHIDHPAFDLEWLDKQPAMKRSGLLLRAHRESKYMTQETLAGAVFRDRDLIGNMERGATPLSKERVEQLSVALNLTPQEKGYFAEVAKASAQAHELSKAQAGFSKKISGQREDELLAVEPGTRRR